ncbi:glycosyltransferase family 2 protein [Alteromonadaceae bacterium M269]|nr:glycosyltransferase family 2 protein [Alteromonadaceae bacterium M269]
MKLNAICIIQNEADIIQDSLNHALKFCDNIYVLDHFSTDGSIELVKQQAGRDPRIQVVPKNQEANRGQFRSYIYNQFHQQFSASDWWYILDPAELLAEDPRPMLVKAMQRYKNQMRVWQAHFYFTDRDLQNYENENQMLSIVQRRRYYRIKWREPRFFRNCPSENWVKEIGDKVPPFCSNLYHPSPVCLHYAERTPEQIGAHQKIKLKGPMQYLHVNNQSIVDGLTKADDCFYFQPGLTMKFPLADRLNYYLNNACRWFSYQLSRFTHTKPITSRKPTKVLNSHKAL